MNDPDLRLLSFRTKRSVRKCGTCPPWWGLPPLLQYRRLREFIFRRSSRRRRSPHPRASLRFRKSLTPALLLLAGCAIAAAHTVAADWEVDSRGVLTAIAQAPVNARSRQNPYDAQPDAVLAGAKLYRQHCAECHGQGGWGTDRAANLHASDVQNATPGELEWFLRNGNLLRGMPSWSGLPEQRRWQLVAYLKTLR